MSTLKSVGKFSGKISKNQKYRLNWDRKDIYIKYENRNKYMKCITRKLILTYNKLTYNITSKMQGNTTYNSILFYYYPFNFTFS